MSLTLGDLSGFRKINLVGRQRILEEIYQRGDEAEEKKRSALIYLEGKGGIGKTAILENVLAGIKERDDALVVEHLLDIYHLENQTVRGFCDTLVAEFIKHQSEFKAYKDNICLLDDAYMLADYDKAAEYWQKAEKALAASLSRLTKDSFGMDRTLWIIVDTAEMLYLQAIQQDTPKMGTERLSLWLPTFLPLLRGQPIILILAGRPSDNQQISLLDVLSEKVKAGWLIGKKIRVDALDANACRLYLQEVSNELANDDDKDGADRIRNYLKKFDSKDLARETKGEPLSLAMTCDIIRTGGALPIGFFGGEENGNVSAKDTLIDHYLAMETPLGITIQAMAVLRKGADAKLLASVMGIQDNEVEKNLRLAVKLTLVKTRLGPNKRRYFLHDEIYDLYASQIPDDTIAWRDTFESITKYYKDELIEIEAEMEKNPGQLRHFQAEYRRTQVELMHYVLWFYPWSGFGEYFQQSVEAIGQKIQDWNNLLGVEWERTCKILERENRYPVDDFAQYLKWDRDIKQIDNASTWAKNDSDITLNAAMISNNNIVLDSLKNVAQAPILYQIYIWLVRALLVLRNQKPEIAGDTFESCMEKARDTVEKARKGDFRDELSPALRFLEAYTSNYEGLVKRRQGNYQGALDAYYRAGVEMRKRKLGGLSTVLINQAYAMSMLGLDQRARETSLEAYDLAQKHGSPYYQVRALNVRSLVETSAGYPTDGEIHALEALDILRSYPDSRLEGLVYISLARVYRYQWNQAFQHQITDTPRLGKELLSKALVYMEGSAFIQSELKWGLNDLPKVSMGAIDLLGEADKENWVTALNECGCLWREVSWLIRERSDENNAKKTAYERAKKRLEQAAGINNIARRDWKNKIKERINEIGGSYYWPVLALTNLGWYYLYLDVYPYKDQKYEKMVGEINEFIQSFVPDEYLLQTRKELQGDWGGSDVLLWATLGKQEMLRGYMMLRSWRKGADVLDKALEHIYFALEYNYLAATEDGTYNIRRAEMGLETRIKKSKNWQTDLLPKLFKVESIVGPRLEDAHLITKRHVLQWLEKRYGPASLWIEN